MNVLFFAVRNHHKQYFSQLGQTADYQTTQVRHRQWWLKRLWPLFKSHPGLDDAVAVELRQYQQASPSGQRSLPALWIRKLWLALSGRFLYRAYYAGLKHTAPDAMVCWNGIVWHQRLCALAADQLGIKTLYMENGCLPATTTVDALGINYENSTLRTLEQLPNGDQGPDTLRQRLPTQLSQRQAHKSKQGLQQSNQQSLPEHYIFVPFQVDTDSQIICFSPWIRDMRALYQVLVDHIEALPEPYVILLKEHPSCPKQYDDLHTKHPRLQFANDHNTQQLIENAALVMTINSSVGLEAMLLERPVVVLGQAFYSLPELCLSAQNPHDLCGIMAAPSQWQCSDATPRYLSYLYNDYLVQGSWKEASPEHLQAMNQRVKELAQ